MLYEYEQLAYRKECPNMVDRPSIDIEVNLCYRGSVDGAVDIDRRPVDHEWTHLNSLEDNIRERRVGIGYPNRFSQETSNRFQNSGPYKLWKITQNKLKYSPIISHLEKFKIGRLNSKSSSFGATTLCGLRPLSQLVSTTLYPPLD
jgi:hypothetical protein